MSIQKRLPHVYQRMHTPRPPPSGVCVYIVVCCGRRSLPHPAQVRCISRGEASKGGACVCGVIFGRVCPGDSSPCGERLVWIRGGIIIHLLRPGLEEEGGCAYALALEVEGRQAGA